MTLMDHVQNALEKILPPKRGLRPNGVGGGAQFNDDMIISKPAIIFHVAQIFFNFLAMCCFASVAAFQAKWNVGPSGLSGFAVFISVAGILLPLVMLLVPVVSEKYDKLTRLARGMSELRVAFILTGTGTFVALLVSFITTISAWTQAGCKNKDNDPHADLGDDFKNGLGGWCTTKKAGAIFFWFAFIFWTASLVLNILYWRNNKSTRLRDPPFEPPYDSSAGSAMRPGDRAPSHTDHDDEDEEESLYEQVPRPAFNDNAPSSPFRDSGAGAPASRPYSGYSAGGSAAAPSSGAGRASMDPYGAFADPPPSGFGAASGLSGTGSPGPGVSRTMQYADPYAAVRASIASSAPPSSSTPPGAAAPVAPNLPYAPSVSPFQPGPPSYESYTGYAPR